MHANHLIDALMGYPLQRDVRFIEDIPDVKHARQVWSHGCGVMAIGLGEKQGKPAIRVHVNDLNLGSKIPRSINAGHLGNYPIDTLLFQPTRFQSFTHRQRPIQPGCSISHWEHNAGTATALVERTISSGAEHRFLLSCEHVLYSAFNGNPDRVIVQPAIEDQVDSFDNRVALQFRSGGVEKTGVNTIDAAIARLRTGVDMSNQLPLSNEVIRGVSSQYYVNQPLVMYGRTSGRSLGHVEEITSNTAIGYETNPPFQTSIRFRDVVKCWFENNGPGDSGAPVLDLNSGKLLGIHMSGNPDTKTTYFCKIKNVFDALHIRLASG